MKEFEMIGGDLCLDFVNTIHQYGAADPREELETFADLIAFVRQAKGISDRDASTLQRQSANSPKESNKVLTSARDFRDALYRIISAIKAKKAPARDDWSLLNQMIARVYQNPSIGKQGNNFVWVWRENSSCFDRLLSPIVRSAAELLTSDRRKFVRECFSETCTWLFLDLSKNQTRRWCEMKKCGNRAKWHRHYDRVKRKKRL